MDNDDHVKLEKGYLEHEEVDHKKDNQLLQSKLRELEFQKIELEREVKVLREKNEELVWRIASIETDSEFEGASMRNADREVENWKQKCKDLESQLFLLQGSSGFGGKQIASIRQAEQFDNFADMSPAVNSVIQDRGCEGYKGLDVVTPFPSAEDVPYSKAFVTERQGNEDNLSDCSEKFPFAVTARRKRSKKVVTSDNESDDDDNRGERSQNVVTSDDETDDDDNIPIGQLARKRIQASAISECEALSDFSPHKRRRLVKLGQCKTDGSENDDDDDSLGDFIVSSSDVELDLFPSEEGGGGASDDSSADFDDILHGISRTKGDGSVWENMADMLAALGKDPLLCMKGVCALYRRETCDEKEIGQGFSMYDKPSGAKLAEFLTGGDPNGDVVKSVEEVNAYYTNGADKCHRLATKYAEQLFDIYQNAEYPYFFPPSH